MENGKPVRTICPICGNYTFVHINRDGTYSSKCLVCKTKLKYIQKRIGVIELMIFNDDVKIEEDTNKLGYNLITKVINPVVVE